MQKKLLFVLMFLGAGSLLSAATIPLGVGNDDNTPTIPAGNKAPIRPWYIDQDGNVLTMSPTQCDYTLTLYDDYGGAVYAAYLPAGTTQVILPTTLSGNFEIRFEAATYYYFGYISL